MGDESVRRRWLLVVVVVVFGMISAVFLGQAIVEGRQDGTGAYEEAPSVNMVSLSENSSVRLWPHTAKRRTFESRTLPVNVVIDENAATVRYLLRERTNAEWTAPDEEWAANGTESDLGVHEDTRLVINGTRLEWRPAAGATRYTMFYDAETGDVRWLDATYQLHHGDYFGSRYHLRLYASGDGEEAWTAVQTHHEHWDWFRLRHTVGSLSKAQQYVEHEFFDEWYLSDVTRRRFVQGSIGGFDGWVTVVELSDDVLFPPLELLAPVAVGLSLGGRSANAAGLRRLASRWRSRLDLADVRSAALFLALALLPLLVRIGSVRVERADLVGNPDVIGAAFYPFIAVGLPVTAFLLSRGLSAEESFVFGAVGLGTGLLVEYSYLGIAVVPLSVVIHRFAVLLAIGLIAAGGARYGAGERLWNDSLADGTLVWIVVLLWPLWTAI